MVDRKVPFFDYQKFFSDDEKDLMPIITDVCRRGAFILQKDLEDFENELADYLGVNHVIGLANATDALHLLVRIAGIQEGDEVIFSSHTMVASPAAIHFAGAVPVPVECGPDHLIDPAAVEAAITSKTRAIMPTQLNGRVADMAAIQEIAEKYDLLIIEDSAQALGAKFRGKVAGSFGVGGCISFYPAKTLGALGDGGCVVTNSDETNDRLRQMRDHGRDANGEVVGWGLNSRLDNLQAAILRWKLKHYDEYITHRRDLAQIYHAELDGLTGLKLPPCPENSGDHFDIYQNYEISCDGREELRSYLKAQGIGTMVQWGGKAVHMFERLGFPHTLPSTESLFKRCVMLPMNTTVSTDDVYYVCGQIKEFYRGHSVKAA